MSGVTTGSGQFEEANWMFRIPTQKESCDDQRRNAT